ncbi:stromal cell-derived factor 2-like protein [Selaginella moellendorffii]|uniref:stromal cell-derived factor 2-like protein n=1 Tax=Selaginella moellendorffii TaxID=88036 RepID=UPI000D1C853B|nr:stromal cell-derived factor 2-like protein [Selaginella moellendorffii]XP_024518266.1 stromal cell-derived factor 2-like protein [Selaginella moellendorffii]|eukprot:XP_002988714.2 stromal cell-derived factor 2-like protein [Selaginella moellendorffii]
MGAAWLSALLAFLWLTSDARSDVDTGAPPSSQLVTYGSVIKLQHASTKFRLHSHEVPYGSGSGQQSVTAFSHVNDGNSYWIVKPGPQSEAQQGDGVAEGSIVRLQHMRTRRWLHSHLHQSPLTGNLEVSAFGSPDVSDTGDTWRLEIEGKEKTWTKDLKVRLYHMDTGGYLHSSHDNKYTRIVAGQLEVCGVQKKSADNVWLAAEGIYLPRRTK